MFASARGKQQKSVRQIQCQNSALIISHNTFRDCRVHISFRQPKIAVCTIAHTFFVYWAINIFSPFHQMYSQVKRQSLFLCWVFLREKKRGEGGDARPWAKSGEGSISSV